ncbi:class I SAM-dependent methyltransferase [Capnocytophaga bilenii]|uniref:class I SAM-dependent methyltransferase n=1 Tax=Capnocytophaga bilenii TaxID=2819369 RepID=UPI0028D497BE|nr:class I SAM-dependent methyltransferase [Capnocytophaga bilenii]
MDLQYKEIQAFIKEHLDIDTTQLLLKKPIFATISNSVLAQQIEGYKVAQRKFPSLLAEGIQFPKKLNLEQTSSEATATYKAKLLQGEHFLDLTAGFGIDAYFLSQSFEEITLVEQDAELLQLVAQNWKVLGRKATFVNSDAESFLQATTTYYDVIYIDPARRDHQLQKKFLLEDLSPNILELQELLLKKSAKVVTKLSPLIDIHYLLHTLNNITHIEIIALRNEVKEVLVIQEIASSLEEVEIRCVNLQSKDPILSFKAKEVQGTQATYGTPGRYLYIPNNALLKSGAFNYIATYYGLKKLEVNTHLYTSDELIDNFAGRILEVAQIHPKQIKKKTHYNIITKNYPLSVAEIKKKYHLEEGGTEYLIFTRSVSGMELLLGQIQK